LHFGVVPQPLQTQPYPPGLKLTPFGSGEQVAEFSDLPMKWDVSSTMPPFGYSSSIEGLLKAGLAIAIVKRNKQINFIVFIISKTTALPFSHIFFRRV
jgi:hypothetical protein